MLEDPHGHGSNDDSFVYVCHNPLEAPDHSGNKSWNQTYLIISTNIGIKLLCNETKQQ